MENWNFKFYFIFQPFMDHHSIINGIDMSNVLFILLSNTGGREITQKSFEFWQNGRIRNELRHVHVFTVHF